jgi:hypothetical protein
MQLRMAADYGEYRLAIYSKLSEEHLHAVQFKSVHHLYLSLQYTIDV